MSKQEIVDEMCKIKGEIAFNKQMFEINHKLANKYLAELDKINTTDRDLYAKLGILEKLLSALEEE